MKVQVNKAFFRDLKAIPPKTKAQIEQFVFEDVPQAESIQAVRKIEKMQGYTSYYKARFGNYRVGMKIEGKTVTFERVLNRKEIYRKFP